MNQKVSTVITTYKRDRDILNRAIKSVLNQTYPNIELLILDDNNHDSDYHKMVVNLVKDYQIQGKDIRIISPVENQGVQKSRNAGIENAKGEFIAFLDDDDEWSPFKIEKQLNIFNKSNNHNLAMVHCWYSYIVSKNDGDISERVRKSELYDQNSKLIKLLRSNHIGSTSFPLLRKDAVIRVGKFDEKLPASQDYDLWLRIAKEFDIAVVKESLGNYYIHSGERISSTLEKKEEAMRYIDEKYKKLFLTDKIAYGNRLFRLGKNLVSQKKSCEGRSLLFKSFKKHPQMSIKIKSLIYIAKSYI